MWTRLPQPVLALFVTLSVILGAVPPGRAARLSVSPQGPWRSIAAALQAARPGDTVEVQAGLYREHLVLRKPLTLIGRGHPVIDGEGRGTVVRLEAPGCVLQGFVIRGSGDSLTAEDAGISVEAKRARVEDNRLEDVLFGIYLKGASGSVVRHNHIVGKALPLPRRGDGIRLWYSSETLLEGNIVEDTRDVVIWFSQGTVVRENRVLRGRYGLHYMYSDDNLFTDNQFLYNTVGTFLMYSKRLRFFRNIFAHSYGSSGYGIGLKDADEVLAAENLVVSNRVGISLDNSPRSLDVWNLIRSNVIAFNGIGISLLPSVERNRFVENSFVDNLEQVEVRGGGELSGNRWSEGERGNYWSDYQGYDANGDGIGDLPYRAQRLFERFTDRYPELRLFLYSPVVQAIELAARVVPLLQPEPKLVDATPLVHWRIPAAFRRQEGSVPLPLLLTSLALVGGSLGLYLALLLTPSGQDDDRR